jgi:DivIVA domain-containing protein
MPFAPHEIENKRFVVALRGYATQEVDAFLRAVAADYRAALERADHPGGPGPELLAEIERVMLTSRERADEDATAIRVAAEREAAEIRAAANAEAEAVYAQIARQAEQMQRLEADLRDRLHALDHAVREGKQALGGLSSLVP